MTDIKLLSSKLFNLLNVHKCVSALGFSLDDTEKYINTITAINSLDEYATSYGGRDIADYKIPAFLKDLILPSAVTISGSSTDVDFLKRPEPDAIIKTLDVSSFNDISYYMVGAFRSPDGVVSISRSPLLLSDVKDRQSYEGQVRELADPFYPVPLSTAFTKEKLFTLSEADMLNDALRHSILQFRLATRK